LFVRKKKTARSANTLVGNGGKEGGGVRE
jgi:hypothetical protein